MSNFNSMPSKITPIELSEQELESLIVSDPSQIEEGLKVVSRQHPTDSGPLDILAIDLNGSAVVLELKIGAEEDHLDQGLRYYDWVRKNIAWLARTYSAFGLNPDRPIRLALIAPSFTDNVRCTAKYVDIELQLFQCQAVRDSRGERTIFCTEIDIDQPSEPPEILSEAEKINYIQDEKVRSLFKTALDELNKIGVERRSISHLWFSFRFKGKRFLYMCPKRKFFVAEVLNPDGTWYDGRIRISSRSEWKVFSREHIQPYIAKLKER